MGFKDYEKLYEIYKLIQKLKQKNGWNFKFDIDSGNYETILVFNHETGEHRKIRTLENWSNIKYPEEVKCPDLLCYDLRAIIEYEEHTGPRRSGAHLAKKGHGFRGDMPNKRDENRNKLYLKNFRLFQIHESELELIEESLEGFLRQIIQQDG